MEQLIEIKTTKEQFMGELETLRLDIFKEKTLLESLQVSQAENNNSEELD